MERKRNKLSLEFVLIIFLITAALSLVTAVELSTAQEGVENTPLEAGYLMTTAGPASHATVTVAPADSAEIAHTWQLIRPASPGLAGLMLAGIALGAAALALYLFQGRS